MKCKMSLIKNNCILTRLFYRRWKSPRWDCFIDDENHQDWIILQAMKIAKMRLFYRRCKLPRWENILCIVESDTKPAVTTCDRLKLLNQSSTGMECQANLYPSLVNHFLSSKSDRHCERPGRGCTGCARTRDILQEDHRGHTQVTVIDNSRWQ